MEVTMVKDEGKGPKEPLDKWAVKLSLPDCMKKSTMIAGSIKIAWIKNKTEFSPLWSEELKLCMPAENPSNQIRLAIKW